jgi:NAD(P)H-dependent FMN reductase
MGLNLVLIFGSVRAERRGTRALRFLERAFAERHASLYRHADAFVIMTGEYNHSMPPALVNLLDHFLEEYFWRPSPIVSYSAGPFGGVRAAVQLRAPLCELGMPSIPSLFPIPRAHEALSEDGAPRDPAAVARRFNRFASELEWYAAALKEARGRGIPY